jgi:preprotein translocase subunit SecG
MVSLGAIPVVAQTTQNQGVFQQTVKGLQDTGKAADLGSSTVNENSFAAAVGNIVQQVIAVLGVLFAIYLVYGGIVWLTAAGDESRVSQAKDTIKNAIIGLAIVMTAYAITRFVFSVLETSTFN